MKVLDASKRIPVEGIKKHPFFKDMVFETLHTNIPPKIQALPYKLVFEEDVIAEEEAKRKKMQEEESEKWLIIISFFLGFFKTYSFF